MKNYVVKFGLLSLMLVGYAAHAEDQVLCITTTKALIYEDNLKVVAFSGERNETVVPFQGWGANSKVVDVKGQKVTYIRAQFTDREEEDADNDIGWVRQQDVKPKSQCKTYVAPKEDGDDDAEVKQVTKESATAITGLNDADCCRFPLASSAQMDYRSGMRKFGYGRSGGARKHAACDLYHRDMEPIYAVADGVVLRDRQAFYGGTAATEIKHTGGFVARYGEIAFNYNKKLEIGGTVKAGQLIGYMKKTKTGRKSFNHPMLHFELYKGNVTGDLTVPNSKLGFKRRSDLLNPTSYLQKWEGHRG